MVKFRNAERLLEILSLERLEHNIYRGQHEDKIGFRLFGGQILSQALAGAYRTVDNGTLCHSLHGYFLRPGSWDLPATFTIDRIRDGRSFTTRRILAIQNGEAIFSMDASFQTAEAGLEHQIDMASLPHPDEVQDDVQWAEENGFADDQWAMRIRPYETRSVRIRQANDSSLKNNPVWIKYRQPVATDQSDSQAIHQQLLAYASDMGMVSSSYLPHSATTPREKIQMASLDHALWFHKPIDVNNWLVYIKDSSNAAMSRGFNRGAFYDINGTLVASSLQEGLLREL